MITTLANLLCEHGSCGVLHAGNKKGVRALSYLSVTGTEPWKKALTPSGKSK